MEWSIVGHGRGPVSGSTWPKKSKFGTFVSTEINEITHGREPNIDLGQFPPGEVGGEEDKFFLSLENY